MSSDVYEAVLKLAQFKRKLLYSIRQLLRPDCGLCESNVSR